VRLGLEVARCAIALAVPWGKPPSTAPLENRVVTAPCRRPGDADIFLVSLDTTRARITRRLYGHDRPTSPNLEASPRTRSTFTQARSTAGWTPGRATPRC
jgi:hypothetical protein